jgi:hypothetical protein
VRKATVGKGSERRRQTEDSEGEGEGEGRTEEGRRDVALRSEGRRG